MLERRKEFKVTKKYKNKIKENKFRIYGLQKSRKRNKINSRNTI